MVIKYFTGVHSNQVFTGVHSIQIFTGVHSNQILTGVHSNQDLIWCVITGVYMGFGSIVGSDYLYHMPTP